MISIVANRCLHVRNSFVLLPRYFPCSASRAFSLPLPDRFVERCVANVCPPFNKRRILWNVRVRSDEQRNDEQRMEGEKDDSLSWEVGAGIRMRSRYKGAPGTCFERKRTRDGRKCPDYPSTRFSWKIQSARVCFGSRSVARATRTSNAPTRRSTPAIFER